MRARLIAVCILCVWADLAQTGPSAAETTAARLAALPSDHDRRQFLEDNHIAVTGSLLDAIIAGGNQIRDRAGYTAALERYRFALDLAQRAGDHAMQGACWYAVAHGLQALGDLEQALDAYNRSLALGRETGIPNWQLAVRLNGLSLIHRHLGNIADAVRMARESLSAAGAITPEELSEPRAAAQRINRDVLVAQALNSLAMAQEFTGDYQAALSSFDRSYRLAIAASQREGAAFVLNNAGQVYELQRNLDLALDNYRKALKLLEDAGNQTHLANSFFNIGSIYRKTGHYEEALENLARARTLSERAKDKDGIAGSLFGLASVERAQGRLPLAIRHFEESAATFHATGDRGSEAEALTGLADVEIASSDDQLAAGHAERAVELARQTGDPALLWTSNSAAGRANLHLGRNAVARARFGEAIAAIESMRETLAGGEETRERFFEDKVAPYSGMVQVAWRSTVRKKPWPSPNVPRHGLCWTCLPPGASRLPRP